MYLGTNALANLALETGRFGIKTMALLDKANTPHFGSPEISKVSLGVRKNPGILVSGHDLGDLKMLLEQLLARQAIRTAATSNATNMGERISRG